MERSGRRYTMEAERIMELVIWISFLFLLPVLGFIGSGSGTEVDPYIVTNMDELNDVRSELDAFYEQANDLDAGAETDNSGGTYWNAGAGWDPVGDNLNRFTGQYDGAGFTVTGLFIDRPTEQRAGLFGSIEGSASLINIGVEDVNITAESSVGGLVGVTDLGTTLISQCYSTGSVSAIDASSAFLGGLIGAASDDDGSIDNCYSTASVTATNDGTRVGGLIGFNDTDADKCYSTGLVTGAGTSTGGLVGDDSGGVVTNSFWDTQTSGQATSDNGTGKTTAEMQDVSTFTDTATTGLTNPWDFVGNPNDDVANNDYWDIDAGYPFLTAFVDEGETLSAQTGSYTLSGKTASLLYDRLLESQTGSYSIAGKTADLLKGYRVQSQTGSYAIDGKNSDLLSSRLIPAETGSYSISGKQASTLVGYVIPSETGSYVIDGKNADLIVTEVGAITLSAQRGNYAINGKQADLIKDYILSLQTGSYSVDGKNADLLRGYNISAEKGEYVLTGKQVDLLKDYILQLAKGSYQIDGKNADFTIISIGGATKWTLSANQLYNISLSEKELYIIKTSANEILE